jgi:hypothetical protein
VQFDAITKDDVGNGGIIDLFKLVRVGIKWRQKRSWHTPRASAEDEKRTYEKGHKAVHNVLPSLEWDAYHGKRKQ